jgi:hypothetical protein
MDFSGHNIPTLLMSFTTLYKILLVALNTILYICMIYKLNIFSDMAVATTNTTTTRYQEK